MKRAPYGLTVRDPRQGALVTVARSVPRGLAPAPPGQRSLDSLPLFAGPPPPALPLTYGRRKNAPWGRDSDRGAKKFLPGPTDRYLLRAMLDRVRMAQGEPTSGKTYPVYEDGELIGFRGSSTLKPDWMQIPGAGGKAYYDADATEKTLEMLLAGKSPRTKLRERIEEHLDAVIRRGDARDEEAEAFGGFDPAALDARDAPPPTFTHGDAVPFDVPDLPKSRPTVRLDTDTGTLILGARSPLKGRFSMVNPPQRPLVVRLGTWGEQQMFQAGRDAKAQGLSRDEAVRTYHSHLRTKGQRLAFLAGYVDGGGAIGSQAENPRGLVVTAAAARRDPNALYAYLRQQGQTVTAAKRAVLRAFPRAVAHRANPLTRAETAALLRSARDDRARATATGDPVKRAILGGRMQGKQIAARRYGVKPRAGSYGLYAAAPNPLTRAETAAALREARRYGQQGTQQRHVAAARREPFATWRESAARSLGAAEAVRRLALRFGPHSRQGNPPPRVLGAIPGRMTRIEYRRTGPTAGRYYHNFQPASDVRAWALSDGSVILAGRRPLVVRQ